MKAQGVRATLQPILRSARILAVAAVRGCVPPDRSEIIEAREIAARLMDHEVAPIETYLAVQSVQPGALLIFKQDSRITGVFGALFLNEAALEQILERRFDALAPSLDLLTREGERPATAYSWGVAAETKAAGLAVLGAAADVTRSFFPTIVSFTRAVTAAGRHIAVKRYGYRPLGGPDDEWLVRRPIILEHAA